MQFPPRCLFLGAGAGMQRKSSGVTNEQKSMKLRFPVMECTQG